MDLIKYNHEKKRSTYKLSDRYRKAWHYIDRPWLEEHVCLLKKVVPNYLLNYGIENGDMFIEVNIIPGVVASKFQHTYEFMEQIYNFCLENIEETSPYVHGDWVLSNILIHDGEIRLCDWDNLGIYPQDKVLEKLHSDLLSAFGPDFKLVMQ